VCVSETWLKSSKETCMDLQLLRVCEGMCKGGVCKGNGSKRMCVFRNVAKKLKRNVYGLAIGACV